MSIPADIVKHCEKYKQCVGCPMGSCVAPIGDHRYEEWKSQRIKEIRAKCITLPREI